MPTQEIYLFKAARRPLYRKENLHLLAEQRGSVVDLAYNRSWVAADFFEDGAIARGAPVFFIFTERPYTTFVPVRGGEIVSATWDDLMLRLKVALGNWVGVEGTDLATFTQIVKQTGADCVPGRKFVGPKRDHLNLVPYYDEREDEGWRTAVDHVLEMSAASEDQPYRESVFFRSVGLRTSDGELHRARRLPMEPGSEAKLLLHFHNPHLSGAVAHTLRAQAPEADLAVSAPERFPAEGAVEIDLQLVGGHPELMLQIGPAPAHHTHVIERFRTRAGEGDAAIPAADLSRRRGELLGIYDFLARSARFDDADQEDLFERFEQLLPDEQRIQEDRALWLQESGDGEGAYRRLKDLDPELLSENARFSLFRLGLAHDHQVNPIHSINRLALTSETAFSRLLDELQEIEARHLARFLPALALELPVEQLRELEARVARRLESPDAIASMADAIWLVSEDPAWACGFLRERIRTLHLSDASVEGKLLELAGSLPPGEVPEAEEIAIRRVSNRIQAGRVDEATADLRALALALPIEERQHLYHTITERLIERGDAEKAQALLVELAWAACEAGELLIASRAVERAVALVARDGKPAPEWISEAVDKIERAWEAFEPVSVWRKSEEDRRRSLLRERLLNKRILVAGGLKRPHSVARLQTMTGADVDWAESFRGESDALDSYAERIANGRYALVIYLFQKSGHDVGGKLKEACAKADVPFAYAAGAGADGLVRGAWTVVAGTPQ